ncbi:MAG TPA: hypothetical protein PK109_03865 [Candidatus Paceibacterota bacterium]|nr:hypothetical protein [Candidatus Paceibacterota bacterium]
MSSKRVNLAKGTVVDALCEEMNALTIDCNDPAVRAATLARVIRLTDWTSTTTRSRLYESLSNMMIRLGGTKHKRFTRYQRDQVNAAFDALQSTNDNVTVLAQRSVALTTADTTQQQAGASG